MLNSNAEPVGDTVLGNLTVTLPIEAFKPLPVTEKLALPTKDTVPVDSLILDPLSRTYLLGSA